MSRCLYRVIEQALLDLVVPRHAVYAGHLRPPAGHRSWRIVPR